MALFFGLQTCTIPIFCDIYSRKLDVEVWFRVCGYVKVNLT